MVACILGVVFAAIVLAAGTASGVASAASWSSHPRATAS